MSDTYTEVTRQSWGGRIKNSFKGIVVGITMVALAFWLLWWNEGRSVRRYKSLKEGAGAVISVNATPVNPAHEGKLVHFTGQTETPRLLTDPDFGISADAIHLERQVEMYQWRESSESDTKKKVGGSTETTTTYSYTLGWSDQVIDSSTFKDPAGHRNPSSMPYTSRLVTAESVTVGAFQLSDSLVGRIKSWQPLPVQSATLLPPGLRARAHLKGGVVHVGTNPDAPQVGDLRISFRSVQPTVVSVAAQQIGSSLQSYQTRHGSVELLRTGSATAQEMFDAAQEANKTLAWILRAVGFLVMALGLRTIFKIFSVLADVIPLFGNLAEKGLGLFSFALAAFLSLVTIALAWFYYRPLLSIGLLALAALAGYMVLRVTKNARQRGKIAASNPGSIPPPPPPPPAPA